MPLHKKLAGQRGKKKRRRNVEVHNREKEIKEMMDILDAEPSLITFIYGPINSKEIYFSFTFKSYG